MRKALAMAPRLRASGATGMFDSRKFVSTVMRPSRVIPSHVPCSERRRSRPPRTLVCGADHQSAGFVGRLRNSWCQVSSLSHGESKERKQSLDGCIHLGC